MKKFFAFVIAMAMTVAANAALVTFENNGQDILAMPGDIVVLNLVADSGMMSIDASASFDGDAAWVGNSRSTNADSSFSNDTVMNGNKIQVAYAAFGTLAPNLGSLSIQYNGGIVVVNLMPEYALGGSIMDDFSTPADVEGMVRIVPEPMTMSLLGLGGLFAARRRRA